MSVTFNLHKSLTNKCWLVEVGLIKIGIRSDSLISSSNVKRKQFNVKMKKMSELIPTDL
jgi:hypothetical protein